MQAKSVPIIGSLKTKKSVVNRIYMTKVAISRDQDYIFVICEHGTPDKNKKYSILK